MDFWEHFRTYASHQDLKELRAKQRSWRHKSYQVRKEQSLVDQKQNDRIAALEQENDDLKLSLGALIAVLQGRGHLEEAEAIEIIQPLIEPFTEEDEG